MDDRHFAEVQCQIQMSGLLAKRPVGHLASKWSKRLVNTLAKGVIYFIWANYFMKMFGEHITILIMNAFKCNELQQ